jgi:hypothetical protein
MTDQVLTAPQVDNASRAKNWYNLVLWFTLLGTFIATLWDGFWHLTYPFDGFFSPPHVFGYSIAIIASLMISHILFTPSIRKWFGAGFKSPLVKFTVPGSIFLLGCGFVILGFAGLVLDNYWHSNFGLNETNWSLPHAMIGWAFVVMVLGFVACRIAIAKSENQPLGLGWRILFAYLVIIILARPIMGPFENNNSLQTIYASSLLPGLLATDEFQQVTQIYLDNNLSRNNLLAVPLATFWAGLGLAFATRLDNRALFILGIALISGNGDRNGAEFIMNYTNSPVNLLANPANFAGFPLIVLALIYVLVRRFSERWAWGLGAFVFALCVHWIFGSVPGGELMAIPATMLVFVGVALGKGLYDILAEPTTPKRIAPIILTALLVPCVTGLLDLYLRQNL